MFRFTIRDVLWLTVVVALGIGWWINRIQIQTQWSNRIETLRQDLQARELGISESEDGAYRVSPLPHPVFFDRP